MGKTPLAKPIPSAWLISKPVHAARDRIWAVRKDRANRAETAKVIEKHASRKTPTRRRRVTPKKPVDQAQLGFDF